MKIFNLLGKISGCLLLTTRILFQLQAQRVTLSLNRRINNNFDSSGTEEGKKKMSLPLNQTAETSPSFPQYPLFRHHWRPPVPDITTQCPRACISELASPRVQYLTFPCVPTSHVPKHAFPRLRPTFSHRPLKSQYQRLKLCCMANKINKNKNSVRLISNKSQKNFKP